MKYAGAAAVRAYSGRSGVVEVASAISGNSGPCDGSVTAVVTHAKPVQQPSAGFDPWAGLNMDGVSE